MGQFLSALQMVEDSGFAVRLAKPLVYEFTKPADPDMTAIWTVPAGFRSDFATVPRFLWPLIPPHGRTKRAAIVHDYLYRKPWIARTAADAVFLAAMKDSGVPTAQRWAMFAAVRLFGWLYRD